MENKQDFRHIVRIASKDLNGNLPIYRALTKIKGIGIRMAKSIAVAFEKETGISHKSRLGELSEEQDKKLEQIVLEPAKYGVPAYSLNRRKEYESGQDKHLVMADLDLQLRNEIQRLNQIKSYRGLRLSWGLTVRGQRTKSTHRGKGGVVGVTKKDAKAAASPAKKESEKK
jgi:small subunit ribosomal protein S13